MIQIFSGEIIVLRGALIHPALITAVACGTLVPHKHVGHLCQPGTPCRFGAWLPSWAKLPKASERGSQSPSARDALETMTLQFA